MAQNVNLSPFNPVEQESEPYHTLESCIGPEIFPRKKLVLDFSRFFAKMMISIFFVKIF